jgi:hypothetical protein
MHTDIASGNHNVSTRTGAVGAREYVSASYRPEPDYHATSRSRRQYVESLIDDRGMMNGRRKLTRENGGRILPVRPGAALTDCCQQYVPAGCQDSGE